MDERGVKLVIDLAAGRVSDREFLDQMDAKAGGSALGLKLLGRAITDRDARGVEMALHVGHRFGITSDYLAPLLQLATADFHERHEDVVRALQHLAAPESVEALEATAVASYPYLEYDDDYALGIKCLHALEAIATPDAYAAIERLSRSSNEVLAAKATAMLARRRTAT